MNINHINDDCMVEIFNYLSMLQKIQLSKVCKRWNRLLMRNLIINEAFCKEYTEFYSIENPRTDANRKNFTVFIQNTLKRSGVHIKSFFFNECNIFYYMDIFLILAKMGKYCKNIIDLSVLLDLDSLDRRKPLNLNFLFESNPNICKLYFKKLKIDANCLLKLQVHSIQDVVIKFCKIEPINVFYKFLSQLKNVKKINFCEKSSEFIDALEQSNCKNIVDLNIGTPEIEEDYVTLKKLIFRQKFLRELTIDNPNVTEDFIDNIPKDYLEYLSITLFVKLSNYCFNQFQNLKILHCTIFDFNDEVLKGLSKCIHLKEISFSNSHNYLTNIGKDYIGQLSNLETFNIIFFATNIDNILEAISQCNNLKNVTITYCSFTNRGIDGLCNVPNLKNLEISDHDLSDVQLCDIVKKSLKLEKFLITNRKMTKEFFRMTDKVKNNRKDKHVLKICFSQYFQINLQNFNTSSLLKLEKLIKIYEY